MDDEDLAALIEARRRLPHLLVTVAPEAVPPARIEALVRGSVTVSVGHSDASWADIEASVAAGATMVTHLFNAQSQIGSREPGVAGAALADGRLWAGLIADGIHVHPETIAIALRAKRGPGQIFLVSDAMAPAGTDARSFTLSGRTVVRRDGALRLEDGTLAGADLTMIGAVGFMHRTVGVPLDEALRMASLYPAQALGASGLGHLAPGAVASFVHLAGDLTVRSAWVAGRRVFSA
jgi:N-acetylglucosamine-6-phosphate deacetylase